MAATLFESWLPSEIGQNVHQEENKLRRASKGIRQSIRAQVAGKESSQANKSREITYEHWKRKLLADFATVRLNPD